jgi:two-component system phosphate regulon sensor histidine kinase PhoR
MSKRNAFLLGVPVVALALILLLPSFTVRPVIAALLLLVVAVLLVRAFSTKTDNIQATRVGEKNRDEVSSPEIFALGKLFEATMNGMREGLLVVDKDMRVVASNAAAHRLFNLSEGKLDAQRLTELTRNPAIYSAFLDALKGTERSGVKVETHGPERLVFDLRVVPLGSSGSLRSGGTPRVNKGSNGRPADQMEAAEGALGVFIDVTRIERLEHVRQEFLSNVSHELRTPLTAILAFIETLEAGAIDDHEASHRFLAIIRRNATRMHDLIADILELSAIEAGNVSVKAEEIELSPIVTDVIASLATKASEENVVVTNLVPLETMIFADARRLEQMLTNLVENAIKFNRTNGTVSIRYEKKTDASSTASSVGGPRSLVVVEDTGEGIPAQHLERLFERFYRVDRARSRDMGGTGLGLAIVKHLARAHGGEVSVSSELGKGSVFTIELPRST